jgi:PAS domain S-box-containing protein
MSVPSASKPENWDPGSGETSRIQLRDLVALLALPALWKEKDQNQIAHDLLKVVASLLRPDCACVRMSAEGEPALEDRSPPLCVLSPEMADALELFASGTSSGQQRPGEPGVGIARAAQSFDGEQCVVVASSRRPGFPLHSELFILQRAVDQAAFAFHGARLLAREQAARELERHARAEAEAERARLRSFFLQAPIPIAVLTGPDHVYELVNPPFCDMVARFDLIGKPAQAVFAAGVDAPLLDTAFRSGEPFVAHEYPATLNRDGTRQNVIFKLRLDPYRGADGAVQGLILVAVDVTDEVTARRAIQARAAGLADEGRWLESLLDLLPVPVVLVEPTTARVSFSNRAADRVSGGSYPRGDSAEEKNQYFYTDASGSPVPEHRHPAQRAGRGEDLRGLELDWHTPGGTRSLLLSSKLLQARHGHPATVVLAFEDVSELEQTQAALREALDESSKFVSVTEESSDFIGIASLDLDVQFVNRSGQSLVGLEGQLESRPLTIPDFLFPEDRGLLAEFLGQVRAAGRSGREFRLKHFKTGAEVPVWCNVFLLRDSRTNDPIAYATVAHDLTEQKRNWDLRERVIGVVGHDLRNPLSAIQMAATLLRDDPRGAGTPRLAGRILSSAHRIEGIVRDLLDLAKVRLGGGLVITPAPTDGHALCAKIVEEMQAANPGREIRLCTAGDCMGRWDADRLEQVVSNLVGNALQYGPPEIAVNLESRGSATEWTLSVHNFGDPIPTDVLPNIFDPFKRGRPGTCREAGTRNLGLGLFIVRELVQAHGGTIEVTSTARKGTRLLMRLPRQP